MENKNNIKVAFLLNLFFSIIELIGGIITNSISIISDSVHDFGDAISIYISMVFEKKSLKKPDASYTYGYLRFSLFGALITSFILLIGSILVIIEVIPRLLNPIPVNDNGMLILAVLGIITNGLATLKTSKSENLNVKSVNFHMLEDLLGWIAVLIGSILIKITGLYIIDPILSICITIYILLHVIKNIKEIFNILSEKVPEGFDIEKIKNSLMEIDNVYDIHHIHIWSMDNVNNYITLHALVNNSLLPEKYEDIKKLIKDALNKNNINHSTIELEFLSCNDNECRIHNNINPH